MGCCGGISKPKKQVIQEQPTVVQQVNNEATPMVSTQIIDNINSQRAAKVVRDNFHKRRFGNFG